MTDKLLLIDDDQALTRVLSRMLGARFDVRVANSGADGLALFRAECPDVVLTDWVMPGLHGEQLLQELVAAHPFVPIIVMTGQSDEEKTVAAMPYASGWIRKPVSFTQLESLLVGALVRTPQVVEEKGALRLDRHSRVISVDGQIRPALTPAEYTVLDLLWRKNGRVVSHLDIARAATGRSDLSVAEARPISRRYAMILRNKLGQDFILTVRGKGFRLRVNVGKESKCSPPPPRENSDVKLYEAICRCRI